MDASYPTGYYPWGYPRGSGFGNKWNRDGPDEFDSFDSFDTTDTADGAPSCEKTEYARRGRADGLGFSVCDGTRYQGRVSRSTVHGPRSTDHSDHTDSQKEVRNRE